LRDKIPDHSAFSRARNERFRDSDIFRHVFERVVEACISAGLVGGEGFAVDASLIAADANKQRSIAGSEWKKTCAAETASRAVKEYLATLDEEAFGAASDLTPKFVSPSDPAAQWTGAMRGPAFFAYANNYLVDVKFGVIVDVEASRPTSMSRTTSTAFPTASRAVRSRCASPAAQWRFSSGASGLPCTCGGAATASTPHWPIICRPVIAATPTGLSAVSAEMPPSLGRQPLLCASSFWSAGRIPSRASDPASAVLPAHHSLSVDATTIERLAERFFCEKQVV
jgi:hypothetical protein